jgi:acyl carrier protein
MDDTLLALRRLITTKFGIDGAAIDADASIATAGIDSLALAELLFDIEDHFGVTLPDSRDGVDSLRDLADLIARLRSAPALQTAA